MVCYYPFVPAQAGTQGHEERQLKKWNRTWKLELIEGENPTWRDLAEGLTP
ncbi:MAG: hypothetical protein OJF62_000750 [Pseudolabrys sp.]|jgi:predicted GIY-YIG superfamily endonuclease|nr:hypothetical protein [Pseudolabrys sp.]